MRAGGVALVAALLVSLLTACGAERASQGAPASAGGSDHRALSAAELAVFGDAVRPRAAGSFGWDRVHLTTTSSASGTPALRVDYPEHSASQASHRAHGTPTGGAQVYLPLRSGPVTQLWLSYAVRFEPGFAFVKGGKLPGLYGGSRTSGGRIPDGTDGLSTRLMWRTGGAGEVYAYLPSSHDYGTSLGRGNFRFPTGQWVHVRQHVVLNRPGHHDGLIQLWINGRSVLRVDDVVFRSTDSLKIEGIFFSTFFGGNDASWASPRDQYAEFAEFGVSRREPSS